MRGLPLKYRPRKLNRVIGQPDAVAMLSTMIRKKKIPHAMIFTGPSGCGKTTLARILRRSLKCSKEDFKESNSADFRGIETIRTIRRLMRLTPWNGDCYIFLMDEAHQLSPDAQDAFLKMLEEAPDWVYFFLATTDPEKLKPTIRTRCTEIKVRLLSPGDIKLLLNRVSKKERKKVPDEVILSIIEASEGCPRKALVLLDQIIDMRKEKDQLSAVIAADSKLQASKLFSALMTPRIPWASVAKILKLTGDDPEKVRQYMMAAASGVMLNGGGGASKAYAIFQAMRDDFFLTKKAGLIAACWEILK